MSVSNHIIGGTLGIAAAAAAVFGAPAAINQIISGLAKETTIIVCTAPSLQTREEGAPPALVLSSCVTEENRPPITIIVPDLPDAFNEGR